MLRAGDTGKSIERIYRRNQKCNFFKNKDVLNLKRISSHRKSMYSNFKAFLKISFFCEKIPLITVELKSLCLQEEKKKTVSVSQNTSGEIN